MSSTNTVPPPPPPTLFRILKTIRNDSGIRSTLCLPRELALPIEVDASALLTSIQSSSASSLLPKHAAYLPQLQLVHTASSPSSVRQISQSIGISRLKPAQITENAATSFACEVPIFGPCLLDFCKAYTIANAGAGVPSWFLAHLFVELIVAVCDSDAKKKVTAENVRINMHPGAFEEEEGYSFRSWPRVVLEGATASELPFSDEVARCVVEAIRGVVLEWSDSAPFVKAAGSVMETTDPLLLVVGEMGEMLLSGESFWMQDVRARFVGHLSDIRVTSPMQLPWGVAKHVHADLVSDEEMVRGLGKMVVVRFEEKYEDYLKLDAGEEVKMGSGGHAGMRTGRIMVVRFGVRKANFLMAVGKMEWAAMPVPQSRG